MSASASPAAGNDPRLRPAGRSRLSLTLRLTLLFVLASSLVLLALGQLIGRSVEHHFIDLDRDTAEGKLATSAAILGALRSPTDLDRIGRDFESMLIGHDGLAIRVQDGSGRVWFSSPAAEAAPSAARPAGPPAAASSGTPHDSVHDLKHDSAHAANHGASLPIAWVHDGRTFRGLERELASGLPEGRPFRVTIGVDTAHHDHYMVSFRRTLWSFMAIAMVIMGALGWIVARSGLSPLRRLGKEAESVTAARLDRRLTAGDLPVEVDELANTLNEMLARLEDSFRRLSELSSDLAHELRTPIANMMTQTQVGLSQARSAESYRDVLAGNAEELERLARMVSDMLFLAKSEHGLAQPDRHPVDLQPLARQVVSFYEALASERGLALNVQGDGRVEGDRDLLLRALTNLVSNAIRHAAPGSEVLIGIDDLPSDSAADLAVPDLVVPGLVVPGLVLRRPLVRSPLVRLRVRNTGDTIPPEVKARMFDRFFRGDSSRQHDTEGAGLGLAIARSIARIHGGSIDAHSEDGVTEVCIDLPATPMGPRSLRRD